MISGLQLQDRHSFRAELKEQNHFYMKISKEDSSIQLVNKDFVPVPGYNYRIVHNLEAASALHQGENLFVDKEFTIDVKEQFPGEDVTVKRLSNMYGCTNIPHFFDLSKAPTYLEDNQLAPSCIRELGLFPTKNYKSLFISQQFMKTGKYTLVANIDGRFQVISVDDRIPINANTLQPVWGLTYDHPWELILLKAWAKVRNGYHRAKEARPFQFTETFSHNIWKYFNINKESSKFLQYYHDSSRFKNGKIILKTKKNVQVIKCGLTANSASYELKAIHEQTLQKIDKSERKRFVLTIRASDLVKYQGGDLSLYHPAAKNYITEGLNLDHDLLMTHLEFKQLFSSAHITSTRHEDFYSGYKLLKIQKFERKAQYFEFVIPKEGFFDFSIVQYASNMKVKAGLQSRIATENNRSEIQRSEMDGGNNRFLRIKYILVRDNAFEEYQNLNSVQSQNSKTSKMKAIQGQDMGFPLPRFTSYEIQYFKGYSKGSAHFVKLNPGRYILRFKSQNVEFDAKYAFNWTCSHKIDLIDARLSIDEETCVLHDAMVSMMHKYPHFSYDKEQKSEMLTIADSFEEIGYGFASIKCSSNCNRSIIVEVDPDRLHFQGYRLKGRYKVHSGPPAKKFSIKIEAGQYECIVFKKRKDVTKFEWPTKALSIYKKQFKEPRNSYANSRLTNN